MPVDRSQPVYPPSAGGPIAHEWGDAVSEHVVQRFASEADRDAKWSNPPVGALCYVTAWVYLNTPSGWVPLIGVTPGGGHVYFAKDPRTTDATFLSNLSAASLNVRHSGGTASHRVPFVQSGSNIIHSNAAAAYRITYPTPFASKPIVLCQITSSGDYFTHPPDLGGPMADPAFFEANVRKVTDGASVANSMGLRVDWIAVGQYP